ncbi:MAG: hypothetical protein ACRC7G_14090 [Beijerinckiaceae bacterium]
MIPGVQRPLTQILDPYAKAAVRPCGSILAGVFGSNDIRPVAQRPSLRLHVLTVPVGAPC